MSNTQGNGERSSRRGDEALKEAQGQPTLIQGIAFAWLGQPLDKQRDGLKIQIDDDGYGI